MTRSSRSGWPPPNSSTTSTRRCASSSPQEPHAESACLALRFAGRRKRQALALYYAVRDDIRYDPYASSMQREAMRASTTVIKGVSYCVPKAILYCACLRAIGIPARPGFADVKNHLSTEKLTRLMGTDIFAWHGYVSLLLDGKWVKATPAFNLACASASACCRWISTASTIR
jgi:hypothetical protein